LGETDEVCSWGRGPIGSLKYIEKCYKSKKVLKKIGKISSGPNIGRDGYYTLTQTLTKQNYI
jgi:hypothetical protein